MVCVRAVDSCKVHSTTSSHPIADRIGAHPNNDNVHIERRANNNERIDGWMVFPKRMCGVEYYLDKGHSSYANGLID
ncbi:Uncharacterized protein FWK35_00011591 [Aphis craccivora]|uniref:Uncharacterized protein n=1 Tax=Aphis craccivora TaxID=307492 RepID=A0A6G0ZRB5_APHCR|nr:Uncharacterized protein FWK35_00011591 [Aphis craccivora]